MNDRASNIVITLRSLPPNQVDSPEVKRLAQLLKVALRRFGFKCVRVEQVEEMKK